MNYVLQNNEVRYVSGEEPVVDFNQKFIGNFDNLLAIIKEIQNDDDYSFEKSMDYLFEHADDETESDFGIQDIEDLNENLLLELALEEKNILAIMSIINGLYNASLFQINAVSLSTSEVLLLKC